MLLFTQLEPILGLVYSPGLSPSRKTTKTNAWFCLYSKCKCATLKFSPVPLKTSQRICYRDVFKQDGRLRDCVLKWVVLVFTCTYNTFRFLIKYLFASKWASKRARDSKIKQKLNLMIELLAMIEVEREIKIRRTERQRDVNVKRQKEKKKVCLKKLRCYTIAYSITSKRSHFFIRPRATRDGRARRRQEKLNILISK